MIIRVGEFSWSQISIVFSIVVCTRLPGRVEFPFSMTTGTRWIFLFRPSLSGAGTVADASQARHGGTNGGTPNGETNIWGSIKKNLVNVYKKRTGKIHHAIFYSWVNQLFRLGQCHVSPRQLMFLYGLAWFFWVNNPTYMKISQLVS
jgi:hypothetical protein